MEKIKLITQELKLRDLYPKKAAILSSELGIKEDEVQLIRKGITPSEYEIKEGERAVISYITTGAVDRDREIVDPDGAILDDYMKNPVVLFGHDYRGLPIGKNVWIKRDNKGLIAKTVYANHEEADKVFRYRKDGFPLAESIGFVPLEWEDYNDEEQKTKGGARRTYKKWLLLEYSDVPVPSNPEALQVAVAKGLLPLIEEKLTDHPDIKKDIVEDIISPEAAQILEATLGTLKGLLDKLK